MPRNRDYPLPRDSESRLLEGSHGVEMIDAGDSRHVLSDLYLTHVGIAHEFVAGEQIFANCVTDIGRSEKER